MRPDPLEPLLSDENLIQMCQLSRDDSFGWPLQDPGLESEHDAGVLFGFDQANWSPKPEPAAESAWQHLTISVKAPPTLQARESSLTPMLAALGIPRTLLSDPLAAAAYHKHAMERHQTEGDADNFAFSAVVCDDQTDQHQQLNQEDMYHGAVVQAVPMITTAVVSPLATLPTASIGQSAAMLMDDNVITIGTYTRAERAAKLDRFRRKRERRNYAKRVIYGCRKQFADSRPRVGGRFVVNVNRVVKPKIFLKRGRPRKIQLPVVIETLPSLPNELDL